MECFTKDLAAWGARRQVGGTSPLSKPGTEPCCCPFNWDQLHRKKAAVTNCPTVPVGGQATPFSFLELFDTVQSHNLFC